jgi:hypothetical protein
MRYFAIATLLCAGMLAAEAEPAYVNQAYHRQTPILDVMAVVQSGPQASATPHQSHMINLFRANQIASGGTEADVTQKGLVNVAITRQGSPDNSARLRQNGPISLADVAQSGASNSATINQIATHSSFVAANQ